MARQLPLLSGRRWRVSPTNPVRFGQDFDFERCAALHNQLLEIGWVSSGKSLDSLERRTWFNVHGDRAEQMRTRLSDQLVGFLERVAENADNHSLFYYSYGLSAPDSMWDHHQDHDEEDRFLTLYGANHIVSHHDGIVYVLID